MPRGFGTEERERIRGELLAAGREQFEKYGVRRTKVEDLVRRAGVAKGSFYQFFPSKEALFMELVEGLELEIREKMVRELNDLRGTPREMVRRFLEYPFAVAQEYPLIGVMADPEEAALLMRKISPERLRANQEDDARFFGELIQRWQREGVLTPGEPGPLVGFLRACFALSLQQALIGPDVFKAAAGLMVDAMTAHLLVEKP